VVQKRRKAESLRLKAEGVRFEVVIPTKEESAAWGREIFVAFPMVNFCKAAVYRCVAVPLWFKKGGRWKA
jgi:hypothetical protein